MKWARQPSGRWVSRAPRRLQRQRLLLCENRSVREVRLTTVDGVRYWPDDPSGVGVLTLAGSSGRVDADRARLFATHGALAESVRWFGGQNQNPGPWEIPLELFLGRVEALARECDRVLVCGTSFGSEAALLTGAHSSLVHAVIGFAPSDVVWAGVTPEGRVTSHWTLSGEPVPFVPFVEDWESDRDPPSFTDLYRTSYLAEPDLAAAAAIPVERIPEVVLIAGGDDLVWPATEQAARIRDRRSQHGLTTTVVSDDEAGHRTLLPGEPVVGGGMRMARGGTEEADRRLGVATWQRILPMLQR